MEVEDEFLKTKVPTVIMYHTSFQRYDGPHPHNMLFRMCCFRMGWDPKRKKQYKQNYLSNAYFCFCNMDCLQKMLPGVKRKHLYMGNYYFQSLIQEHVDLLKQYGYSNHILNSWKQLIDEAANILF